MGSSMKVTGWGCVDQVGALWVGGVNITGILDQACRDQVVVVILAHFVPNPGVVGGRAGGACCTPQGWCAYAHDVDPNRMFVFSASGRVMFEDGAYFFDGEHALDLGSLSGHNLHFSIVTSTSVAPDRDLKSVSVADLSQLEVQLQHLYDTLSKSQGS